MSSKFTNCVVSTVVYHTVEKVALMQQPQPRWGHSCVAVNNKAILWGGMQNGLPAVHDNELKTKFLSKIEVIKMFTVIVLACTRICMYMYLHVLYCIV